jgi:hypothetical protein
MNKKADVYDFFGIMFLLLIVILSIIGFRAISKEYNQYKEYKSFCEDRPNFCYCDLWDGGCSFKSKYTSSTSSTNGILTSSTETMSQDTKDLCNLAKQLNDKKTIYKVGCE